MRIHERSVRDLEMAEEESPTSKKPVGVEFERMRFPLTRSEFAVAFGVFSLFATGLFCIYYTMPAAEYGKLKLPRSISDLCVLKDQLGTYSALGFF